MTHTCDDCGQAITVPAGSIGTGYAYTTDNKRICYACCAIRDAAEMEATGRATLYLNAGHVSNWPGTLKIKTTAQRKGEHRAFGRRSVRYDVYFMWRGKRWHGTQFGDNTQICHCKRLKG